jgi:transposase
VQSGPVIGGDQRPNGDTPCRSVRLSWLRPGEQGGAAAARERLTARRLFEQLRHEGYEGASDSVQRHVRGWRRGRARAGDVFIPLWFAPGEAYQFDWSHEVVVLGGLGGVTTVVKVAHIRLCHSRMFLIQAFPRETQEMVFEAHERAFCRFGGSCRRGLYDNMTTAVDAVFLGKERRFNLQPALLAAVLALPGRAGGRHAGGRLGEGPGRERSQSFCVAEPTNSVSWLNSPCCSRLSEITCVIGL